MATVLLSESCNTFYGVYMSGQSGPLTSRSVHPASPVLLTRNGPLTTRILLGWRVHSSNPPVSPIQSLRTDEGRCAPHFANHSLYLMKLRPRRCYPKGNFGRNQLLGDSISLSPLSPGLTINLRVRTASSLHQGFPWLRPTQVKFTTFRVAARALVLESLSADRDRSMVPPLFVREGIPTSFSFLAPSPFPQATTRARVALLGPCFKTG